MSRTVTLRHGMSPIGEAVVCIGVFDGVHIGHVALLRDAVAAARDRGVPAAVLTFDRDPDRVVDPLHAAPQLLDLSDKLELLDAAGPDVVLVVPFDAAVAAMTPDEFLDRLFLRVFTPVMAIVGHDFRFGAKAAGDLTTLAAYGSRHGFQVLGHPLVRRGGEVVSSTRIRALVAAGDVEAAAELLGRPHRVRGTVVHGRGAGGELGTPTANLEVPAYAAVPADGVYAGLAELDGRLFSAAVSVGAPPTFPGAADAVEVHLLDFEGSLYGRTLDVRFLARLRKQRRFDSPDALAAAIAEDVRRTRSLTSTSDRNGRTQG